MGIRTWGIRAAAATGAIALISVVAAPAALAHECFKKQWSDAAYTQQSKQKRWMPLDTLAEQFIIPEMAPDCAGKVALAPYMKPWMKAEGISHIPLIYMNASIPEVAYGAWANGNGNSGPGLIGSGKESKAIGYLGNHMEALDQILVTALADAVSAGACELPG